MLLRHALAAHVVGHHGRENVRVAAAAVRAQAVLVADVVGDQQSVEEALRDERELEIHPLRVGQPVGRTEGIHPGLLPEGVEGDVAAARGEAAHDRHRVLDAVHVAQDHPRQIRTGIVQAVRDLHRRLDVAADVNGDRGPAPVLRPRRGAQHLGLVSRQRPRAAELADDPGAHPARPHALENVVHDLVLDLGLAAFVHARRVRAVDVVAGAHDDVEAGGPCDTLQAVGIPFEPDVAHLDQGVAAFELELHHLPDRQRLVVEMEVVVIAVPVAAHPGKIPERHPLTRPPPLAAAGRLRIEAARIVQEMLVHHRHPESFRGNRPEHRLRFAAGRGSTGQHGISASGNNCVSVEPSAAVRSALIGGGREEMPLQVPSFPRRPAMAKGPVPAVAEGTSRKYARSSRLAPSFPRKRESTKNKLDAINSWRSILVRQLLK